VEDAARLRGRDGYWDAGRQPLNELCQNITMRLT